MVGSWKFVVPEKVGLHQVIDELNSPLKVLGLYDYVLMLVKVKQSSLMIGSVGCFLLVAKRNWI